MGSQRQRLYLQAPTRAQVAEGLFLLPQGRNGNSEETCSPGSVASLPGFQRRQCSASTATSASQLEEPNGLKLNTWSPSALPSMCAGEASVSLRRTSGAQRHPQSSKSRSAKRWRPSAQRTPAEDRSAGASVTCHMFVHGQTATAPGRLMWPPRMCVHGCRFGYLGAPAAVRTKSTIQAADRYWKPAWSDHSAPFRSIVAMNLRG